MLHSRTSGSASVGLIATLLILSVAPRADAQYSWSAPATGFYDVGINWDPAGGPPGALDNATINAGGAGPYTVTLRDNRSIHMLTLNSADLTFVQSAGMFTVGTGISIASGTYQLNGGTISGGTMNGSSTGRLVANGNLSNTLDAVTVAQSALDLSAGTTVLRFTNGTDFSVLNTLTLGGNSSLLRLKQSGTLHNLNLTLATAAAPNNAALQLYGGQSVTLAPSVTVTAGPGVGNNVGASQAYGDSGVNNLTNQGILQANVAGTTLKINPSGVFTNATGGQVIASNGGTVEFGTTNWVNLGTITVNASTLNLSSDFNVSGIGTVVRTGGAVNLLATATGGAFDLQSFGGNVNLVGGHVMGGTLFSSGSARLTANGDPANSLAGVMIGANALDLSASTTILRLLNGTDFTALNTVTLGGNSSLFRLEQSGTLHNLNLTLATAASPNNAAFQLYGGQAVTLASTVTVTAGPGIGNNVGASQNYGDLGVNNLTSQGILQANVAGTTLKINPSGIFTNAAGGHVIAANGGTVNIATTNWVNQGTIVVNASTLNIQGDFAANNVGTYIRTGGTINLSATLTATGGLDLQTFGGNLSLVGGRILGGTIASTGSARLIPNGDQANTLDGVMVGANALDLSAGTTVLRLVNSADFSVPTTLTLGGNSSLLRVEQSGTLHNLDLTLASTAVPNFAAFQLYGGQSVTLASTVTVTAGPGSGNNVGASHLYGDLGVNNLTNQGILQANVSGRTLSINPSGVFTNAVGGQVIAANGGTVNIASTSWANQGTITVNASTLNLQADVAANNVGTFVRTGGTINLSGTVNATGGTLDLQAFGGNVNFQGGRILGGNLISSGSARLLPDTNFNNRLDGAVAALGVVDLTPAASRLVLTGGANFSGTGAVPLGNSSQVFLSQTATINSGISFAMGPASSLSAEGGNTATLGATTPQTVTVTVNPGPSSSASIGTSFLAGGANNTVLINQGTIQFDPASPNATLILQAGGNPAGNSLQNQGIIAASVSGTTVTFSGPLSFTNTGTLLANGGTINIPSPNNFTNFNAGTLTGGTYQALAGSVINFNGRVITTLGPGTSALLDTPSAVFTAANTIANNNGTFTISNGRQHTVPTFTNAGTLVVGTAQGDLATLTSNVQVNSGGIVKGTGTIAGSVSLASGSTLAPGTGSPSILTVAGPVTMTSGATYGVQLGGTTVGTGYSQLNLAGGGSIALNNATLATSINYVPGLFDSWTIINGGNVSGQFLNHPNNSVVVLGTFMGTTYKATIVYNATSVGLINPVPEPTTILAMSAAAAGVTIGVRRRFKWAGVRTV